MLHVQGPSGLQEGTGARSQPPVAAAEDSQWDQLGFTCPIPCLAGGQDPPHHGHVTVQKVSVPIPRTAPTHTQWGYPREHQGRRSLRPQPCTHRCQGRPPQHSRVLAGHCALITSEQLLSWMLRCSGPHEPPDTELQRKLNLLLLHSPSKSNCFGN